MKPRIILISGLAASGKTVTGELLQERLENCARVESDFLILVKPFVPGLELSKLKIDNTVSVVKNFISKGYENILIIGAVWNQSELDLFLEKFHDLEVIVFWLNVDKNLRLSRAEKRNDPGDDSESINKIENVLGMIELPLKMPNGKFYNINVDGNKTPETVASEVWENLK